MDAKLHLPVTAAFFTFFVLSLGLRAYAQGASYTPPAGRQVNTPSNFVPAAQLVPYAPPAATGPVHMPVRPYMPVDPNAPVEEKWKTILMNFPPDERLEPALKEKAKREFLDTDTNAMPPEWRALFLEKRLWGTQVTGDWDGMLKVLAKLMAPQAKDPKRSRLDADLLYQAAGYFDRVVFFPPAGTPKMSQQEKTDYWRKNYRDVKKAKEIYQYVVDRFDLHYPATIESLSSLAACQGQLGETTASLASLARLGSIDFGKVTSVDHREGNGALISADLQLQRNSASILHTLETVWQRQIETASSLPGDQAVAELRALQSQYRGNPAAQKAIQDAFAYLAER